MDSWLPKICNEIWYAWNELWEVLRNVSNKGAAATFQFMVCALKDFKAWMISQPFCSCEMSVRGFEMALMCQRVVSQLQNTLQNGALASKWRIFKAWRASSHFVAAKQVSLAAKWHSCAMGSLHSCENFRRGGWAAAKPFRSKEAIFTAIVFRLRNLADHALSLLLSSSWFPTSFFHLFWHSSWFWSSKNLYYIKSN